MQLHFEGRNNSGPCWRGLCRWERLLSVSVHVRRWTEKAKTEVSSLTLARGSRKHNEKKDKTRRMERPDPRRRGLTETGKKGLSTARHGSSVGPGSVIRSTKDSEDREAGWAHTGQAL